MYPERCIYLDDRGLLLGLPFVDYLEGLPRCGAGAMARPGSKCITMSVALVAEIHVSSSSAQEPRSATVVVATSALTPLPPFELPSRK